MRKFQTPRSKIQGNPIFQPVDCASLGVPGPDRGHPGFISNESKPIQTTPLILQRFGTLLVCILIAGCSTTRSISNSSHGDPHAYAPRGSADPGFEYRGELNEFDVLGVDRSRMVTDEEIVRALERPTSVELKPGSHVLLVQSGAVLPDGPMLSEMENHFGVVPFSGVPPRQRTATDAEPTEQFSYARSLRLAAARAGAENIVCYWGTLESARRRMETKTVSWVPIAGWMLPDESQAMRIRLKIAIIDVRTGSWQVVATEPFTDKSWSTSFTRSSSDRKQVEELKQKAYKAGVSAMLEAGHKQVSEN